MSLSECQKGIVCFTFDDRSFDSWVAAIPLFAKYHAHASFFFYGPIDAHALEAAKLLKAAGHTVGLHTLTHANAPSYFTTHTGEEYYEKEILPQKQALAAAGIEVTSFAYPNNARTAETDAALSPYFRHFRAGLTDATPAEIDRPVADLANTRVLHGRGVGVYYHTAEEILLQQIKTAARENTCLTYFSHDIFPNADFINFPTELLEKALQTAKDAGALLLGFDELP